MRDLKDYITAAKGGIPVNPVSPFNIKEDSAVIENFSREDLTRLFAQRTAETGQQITPEALDYTWEQSRGQPWIVNSLFMRATLRILDETSTETVTRTHIHQAREQMILARETHRRRRLSSLPRPRPGDHRTRHPSSRQPHLPRSARPPDDLRPTTGHPRTRFPLGQT
jgi:hypothetical protein